MFLITKSITFILLTKRNAKYYTIHPPDAPFFYIMIRFHHLGIRAPMTISINDHFFPSF